MRLVIGASSALVACVLAVPSSAQVKRFLLEETTIDTSQRQQFEQAQRDYCAAVVRGGAPSCLVFAPTTFSRSDRYFGMLAFGSFSHYDEGTYTSKGLTPLQAEELGRRRNPTIKRNDESGFEEVLTLGPAPEADRPLVQVSELQVHPGYEPDVVNWIRSHLSTDQPTAVYRAVAGGDTGRFLVMRYLRRFAELDNLQPLGPTQIGKTEVEGAWPRGVSSVRVTVMRVRSDLSARGR